MVAYGTSVSLAIMGCTEKLENGERCGKSEYVIFTCSRESLEIVVGSDPWWVRCLNPTGKDRPYGTFSHNPTPTFARFIPIHQKTGDQARRWTNQEPNPPTRPTW